MKTKRYLTTALLVCMAYLASSCTPTTTWRDIRSHPQRYVAEEVSIKGEISGQAWNWSNRNGVLILRDRNGDSGRVELPKGKALPGIGSTIAARGKVHVTQNDVGSEAYVLLDHYGRRTNWNHVLEGALETSKELITIPAFVLLSVLMGGGPGFSWN